MSLRTLFLFLVAEFISPQKVYTFGFRVGSIIPKKSTVYPLSYYEAHHFLFLNPKQPTFVRTYSKTHSEYGFWDLKPYYLGTWTLWVMSALCCLGAVFKALLVSQGVEAVTVLQCPSCRGLNTQRAQYPLIKEYGLNHNMKPYIT